MTKSEFQNLKPGDIIIPYDRIFTKGAKLTPFSIYRVELTLDGHPCIMDDTYYKHLLDYNIECFYIPKLEGVK
jgi:hypothetical protein